MNDIIKRFLSIKGRVQGTDIANAVKISTVCDGLYKIQLPLKDGLSDPFICNDKFIQTLTNDLLRR